MSSDFLGPLGGSTVVYIQQVAKPGTVIEFDQMQTVGVVIIAADGSSAGGGSGPATATLTAQSWPAPAYETLGLPFVPEPFVPPASIWCRGPKSAHVTVSYYSTRVNASSAEPGVVFYRWGLEPAIGCRAYWEIGLSSCDDTVGGFGVGGVLTATDSQPGKSDNPGALLYREATAWSIWVDGVQTVVASAATPTRIGVGVQVLAANQLAVQWWLDGVLLNAVPVVWTFDGSLWVPVLCTLTDAVTFTLEDAV